MIGEIPAGPVFLGLGGMAQPDDMTKQAFIFRGLRRIPRLHVIALPVKASLAEVEIDLLDTLDLWLTINMPIHRWRTPPETDTQLDFIHDDYVMQIYARGWLDIDVRLGDHRPWLVEV